MSRTRAVLYAVLLAVLLIASRMPEPAAAEGTSGLPEARDADAASALEFFSDIDGTHAEGSWLASGASRQLLNFAYGSGGARFRSAMSLDLESGMGYVLLGGTWVPCRSGASRMPCIDPEYALELVGSLRDYGWEDASWHAENGMRAAVLELPWAKASRLSGGDLRGGVGTAWIKILLQDGVFRRAEVYAVSASGSAMHAAISVTEWNGSGTRENTDAAEAP